MTARPVLALLAGVALAAGCTSAQPEDRGRLLREYLAMRDRAISHIVAVRMACAAKKLDRVYCTSFEQDLTQMRAQDVAMQALLIELLQNPQGTIDAEKVAAFAAMAAKVAASAYGIPLPPLSVP